MNILLTADWFYPSPISGPGNATYWLAKALTRAGHSVTIVATAQDLPASVPRNHWLTQDFGRVIYTTNPHVYLPFRHVWEGFRAMRGVDVVHVNSLFYPGSVVFVMLARLLGKPVVWSPHGELSSVALAFSPRRKRVVLPMFRWLSRGVTCHATSTAEVAQIRQQFGSNTRVSELPNRMELPVRKRHDAALSPAERSPAECSPVSPFLLFLGRLHPVKAIDQLLSALAQSALFRAGPYTLIIAGPDDGSYQTLLEQTKRMNLTDKVNFVGLVTGDAKAQLFADALVTILPSHSENFGVVVIESLAQGTPVIAATGTPWQLLATDGAGHWVTNDPASLRLAIDTYLTMPPSEYQTYRERAYRLAHNRFDTYKGVGDWERLYQSAIDSAGKESQDNNAVVFHDTNAVTFSHKYAASSDFQERFRVWTGLFARYVRPTDTVLDLGCGSGIFSRHLAEKGCTVTGVDASPAMIALCHEQKTRANVGFALASLPLSNPAEYAGQDVVLLSSVLEYLDDMPGMLHQAHELLKPDGLLVVSMPNRQSAYRTLERLAFRLTGKPAYYAHVRHVVTADAFARQLSAFGFDQLDTAYYAGSNPVSQLLTLLLPEQHVNNLFVSVYRKRDHESVELKDING